MKYALVVYDYLGNKIDHLVNAYDLDYKLNLDKVGKLQFKMDLNDPQSDFTRLKPYNLVRLYRTINSDSIPIFAGFIQKRDIQDRIISLTCPELTGFFKKRLTGSSVSYSGNAGDAIFSLLSYTKGQGEVAVVEGTNNSSATFSQQTFKYKKILDAWENIADAAGVNFWIDPENFSLNCGTRGEDKSANIILISDGHYPYRNNTSGYSVEEDGSDMLNKLYANNGIITQADSLPVSGYPLLEDYQSYKNADGSTSLGEFLATELNKYSNLVSKPEVSPTRADEVFGNFWVGDLVTVIIKENNFSLSKIQRVTAIKCKVGSNLEEIITTETSDIDASRDNIVDVLIDYDKRISQLEKS